MFNSYNIEISSNILISDKKPGVIMINEYTISVNNNYNYTCVYRRGFLDNNLEMVTIDLPVNINVGELMNLLNNVHNINYLRKNWDMSYFNECIAIDWSYEDKTYDVPINSDVGKRIIELTSLNKYLSYSNQEIINLINI